MTNTHCHRLLRLTNEEKSHLKVIFLAKQAPLTKGIATPELDALCGIEPRYNHELLTTLEDLGIDCTPCRSLDEFETLIRSKNYVFTVFNRADFRNGEIYVSLQCEKLGLPYLGAPPNVRAIAEDKSFAKHLALSIGLQTPEWITYNTHDALEAPTFSGPYFIKPRFGASSDEVSNDSIQSDWPGLRKKIQQLLDKGKDVIVEKFIDGIDITVPVLGGAPPMILDAMEEISQLPGGIATFKQKRLLETGRTRRILEDKLLAAQINANVFRFIAHIRPFDYLRVDFRLCKETQAPVFIEFNIGCNLGSHAAIMHAAKHNHIEQKQLIEHLLAYSLARQNLNPLIKT